MTDGLNQTGGKAAMCTAITLQTAQGEALLGRTMDFSHPLEPQLYAVPRGAAPWGNRWAFLGMGQDIGRVVLAARLSGGLAHGPGIRSLAVLNHPAPFQRVPAE